VAFRGRTLYFFYDSVVKFFVLLHVQVLGCGRRGAYDNASMYGMGYGA
jgi:hypothetical protein